jgi:UDP-N-acetyl-D-glucosamine dehydrogenase
VKDLRKSPSIRFIEVLQQEKVRVDFFDPIVPYLKINGIKLTGVALKAETLSRYDCVVVAVDHSKVDYRLVLANAKLVFDLRNVYRGVISDKVVKL